MPGQIPDRDWVKSLRVDIANDPEKFSEWENNFVDSLMRQLERNGDGFGLTIKQKEVCDKIQEKAERR